MVRKVGYLIKNKEGYYSSDESIIRPLSNSISVSGQETNILYMRDQDYAEIYTSDSTQMIRLDKLCKKNPGMYSLIADTGRGKTYRVEDKTLISFRAKKKEMPEEQRLAAGERMKAYHANKNS